MRTFQQQKTGQAYSIRSTCYVLNCSSNKAKLTKFGIISPSMKYIQYDANTCCFCRLTSVIYASVEYVVEQDIAACIQEYLGFQSNGDEDRIIFAGNIMIDMERNKCGHRHCYGIKN